MTLLHKSYTVIPAQPGYEVIKLMRDTPEQPYYIEHLWFEPIIAWVINLDQTKQFEEPHKYVGFTTASGFNDGDLTKGGGLRYPDGKIWNFHDETFHDCLDTFIKYMNTDNG